MYPFTDYQRVFKKTCCFKVPFKKVTHVIFDLDGTILDTESLIGETLALICKDYNKKFTDKTHHKTAGCIMQDIANILREDLNLPLTVDEFLTVFNNKFTEVCVDIKLMPGAERLIRHLSACKIPIAVATSSTEELAKVKTKSYKEFFDLMHHFTYGGSDPEVKKGKPAPDVFLVCASRFDEKPKPEKCLVFEDAHNGVKGALAAGMQAVFIPVPTVPYEAWRDATVRLNSLEEMAPELFGLPPFEALESLLPRISFDMHFEKGTENDPVKVWQNIRAEVKKGLVGVEIPKKDTEKEGETEETIVSVTEDGAPEEAVDAKKPGPVKEDTEEETMPEDKAEEKAPAADQDKES